MTLRARVRVSSRARAGAVWIAVVVILIEVVVVSGVLDRSAGAWSAACRGKNAATKAAPNGIDPEASTHQWFARQATEILRNDGFDQIMAFLDSPDPTAPAATDASGAATGSAETYRWRLLSGATAADCELYKQVPDHLHNFWSHKGRHMIVGQSAANYAESSFTKAVDAWNAGDLAGAMTWLGASLHLVDDACVPQHNFFGIAINHNPYELWVRDNQKKLAVDTGAILTGTFRKTEGHGGPNWSSENPRGWVDECAHHSARELVAASANVSKKPSPSDPQWRTADHIAFTQRLSAGYIEFFFRTVGGP